MDMQDKWDKALKQTRIIRPRVHTLSTFETTSMPYIFLTESSVNIGDTVVRKGRVHVDKPMLFVPKDSPKFDGFDFEEDLHLNQDTIINFLLVRGIRFPSYKYSNKTSHLNVFEGPLKKAIGFFSNKLERQEDVHSGLIVGPGDCWQFSVMMFVGQMVSKSAEGDIKRILERFKKEGF